MSINKSQVYADLAELILIEKADEARIDLFGGEIDLILLDPEFEEITEAESVQEAVRKITRVVKNWVKDTQNNL